MSDGDVSDVAMLQVWQHPATTFQVSSASLKYA